MRNTWKMSAVPFENAVASVVGFTISANSVNLKQEELYICHNMKLGVKSTHARSFFPNNQEEMFTSIYISNMMRKNSQLVFDRFWKFNAIKDFVSKLCCRLLLNVISVDELFQIKSWQFPTLILNYFLHVIHLFLSLSCSYFRFHSTCTRKVWPPTRFRYSTVPFFFLSRLSHQGETLMNIWYKAISIGNNPSE